MGPNYLIFGPKLDRSTLQVYPSLTCTPPLSLTSGSDYDYQHHADSLHLTRVTCDQHLLTHSNGDGKCFHGFPKAEKIFSIFENTRSPSPKNEVRGRLDLPSPVWSAGLAEIPCRATQPMVIKLSSTLNSRARCSSPGALSLEMTATEGSKSYPVRCATASDSECSKVQQKGSSNSNASVTSRRSLNRSSASSQHEEGAGNGDGGDNDEDKTKSVPAQCQASTTTDPEQPSLVITEEDSDLVDHNDFKDCNNQPSNITIHAKLWGFANSFAKSFLAPDMGRHAINSTRAGDRTATHPLHDADISAIGPNLGVPSILLTPAKNNQEADRDPAFYSATAKPEIQPRSKEHFLNITTISPRNLHRSRHRSESSASPYARPDAKSVRNRVISRIVTNHDHPDPSSNSDDITPCRRRWASESSTYNDTYRTFEQRIARIQKDGVHSCGNLADNHNIRLEGNFLNRDDTRVLLESDIKCAIVTNREQLIEHSISNPELIGDVSSIRDEMFLSWPDDEI